MEKWLPCVHGPHCHGESWNSVTCCCISERTWLQLDWSAHVQSHLDEYLSAWGMWWSTPHYEQRCCWLHSCQAESRNMLSDHGCVQLALLLSSCAKVSSWEPLAMGKVMKESRPDVGTGKPLCICTWPLCVLGPCHSKSTPCIATNQWYVNPTMLFNPCHLVTQCSIVVQQSHHLFPSHHLHNHWGA